MVLHLGERVCPVSIKDLNQLYVQGVGPITSKIHQLPPLTWGVPRRGRENTVNMCIVLKSMHAILLVLYTH